MSSSGQVKSNWDGGLPLASLPDLRLQQLKHRSGGFRFETLASKLAEIQVTMVVMHAWSQVEHDTIYKMVVGGLPTDTMNRMLDGVNGLSTTTEILLDELEHNQK
jgi:ppGpp synthetase/RelA/SpoT-type nucleotidyltranferase